MVSSKYEPELNKDLGSNSSFSMNYKILYGNWTRYMFFNVNTQDFPIIQSTVHEFKGRNRKVGFMYRNGQ